MNGKKEENNSYEVISIEESPEYAYNAVHERTSKVANERTSKVLNERTSEVEKKEANARPGTEAKPVVERDEGRGETGDRGWCWPWLGILRPN